MILDAFHKHLIQKHLRQSCWRTLVNKRFEMGEKEGNSVAHPNARGVLADSFRPFSPNPFGAGNAGRGAAAAVSSEGFREQVASRRGIPAFSNSGEMSVASV